MPTSSARLPTDKAEIGVINGGGATSPSTLCIVCGPLSRVLPPLRLIPRHRSVPVPLTAVPLTRRPPAAPAHPRVTPPFPSGS